MPIYHPTTRRSIADVGTGIRVETGSLIATTYLDHDPATTNALFSITGAIMVTQLYLEVTTAISANACQPQFNVTFTTPAIAVNPMCAVSASISGALAGVRIVWVGGAVATAAVITDSAGLSDVICVSPHIVGGAGFIGTIGMLCTAATATSGALKAYLHYYPMTADGNAVTAV